MRILYIHQHFVTPYQPGGTRSYWISQELIKNGHEVIMLASNAKQEKLVVRKTIDGIKVVYLKIGYKNKWGFIKRLISFFNFMMLTTFISLRESKIDMVIATSTPLTVGFPALVLKKIKRIPFIFEVRDLWPEVPIQMGALNNRFVKSLAVGFEKSIYKNAKHIIALSPGMQDGVLKRGTALEKTTMISNMAKIDKFWPREHSKKQLKELNLSSDTFKVIYFGAMGIANGFEYLLDAIAELKNEKSIDFIFIGGGKMSRLLKSRKEKQSLDNLHYYGAFNMEKTSEIVNLCAISLVSFSNIPILATNSPNKLFDSLSAGKPLIVNNPGWTKDLVENNNCGVYADCNSSSDLAKKILELKAQPELLKTMGANSRKLAESQYDKSILCNKFVETVHRTMDIK